MGGIFIGGDVGWSVSLQNFLKNNKMRFHDYIDVDYGLNLYLDDRGVSIIGFVSQFV